MNFKKLCEANVNHYNNHTGRHNAIILAYGAVTFVGWRLFNKKLAESFDPTKD